MAMFLFVISVVNSGFIFLLTKRYSQMRDFVLKNCEIKEAPTSETVKDKLKGGQE